MSLAWPWRRRSGLTDRLLRGLPYAAIPTILIGIPVVAIGTTAFFVGRETLRTVFGRRREPSDLDWGV